MAIDRNNFRLLSKIAVTRSKEAVPFFERAMAAPLAEYIERIRDGETSENAVKVIAPDMVVATNEAKKQTMPALGVEAYNAAGAWFGKSQYLALFTAERSVFGKALDVTVEGADQLVAAQIAAPTEVWIAETSVIETQTTSRILQNLFIKAQGIAGADDSLTPKQLADVIFMNSKIADNMTDLGRTMTIGRANMLARTSTIWAYNEGSTLQYEDAGVQGGEWFATLDAATGEWDAALHGTIVPLRSHFASSGQTFTTSAGKIITAGIDVVHPPLHPNCRCVILPVL